jgi:hypothetical protein
MYLIVVIVYSWCISMYLYYVSMYFNVFESIWVYLNVFECIYNIFIVYFNVSIMYFNVFESIWVYLNVFRVYLNVFFCIQSVFQCISMYLQYIYGVFECMHSVFECIWMYLQYICGIFQCAYNIFQCIYSLFQCISMCLNVFINIVIEFHHHFLIVTFLPCLYTMISFPTCYTTTFLFFHSRWSIPTFIQSILTFHVQTSPHIPHSTFYVITGCAEHSGAQV